MGTYRVLKGVTLFYEILINDTPTLPQAPQPQISEPVSIIGF